MPGRPDLGAQSASIPKAAPEGAEEGTSTAERKCLMNCIHIQQEIPKWSDVGRPEKDMMNELLLYTLYANIQIDI